MREKKRNNIMPKGMREKKRKEEKKEKIAYVF
jgi:hypothetical protein